MGDEEQDLVPAFAVVITAREMRTKIKLDVLTQSGLNINDVIETIKNKFGENNTGILYEDPGHPEKGIACLTHEQYTFYKSMYRNPGDFDPGKGIDPRRMIFPQDGRLSLSSGLKGIISMYKREELESFREQGS